ncbi:UDP-N-acetylmuramate dehydrogenase [Vulgatibacter incomptus]|uniref:UDP-N-acetylenolpyruvoylglucosamine reductase n=1 Tax=Vulgatibacter incomptus TaxID=1391653 RepID=A0A0K1PEM2_9BACT|nr:UDP-N-acetylmuramate dehydrogenase [Vulgatibacter incomptus]AKU91861.1 UDP-N-acetylenolpyruvoylglucosamine reductase [Vulgatibacter incomptus]
MSLHGELSRHLRGELRANEPLAVRTSVRTGGAADLFARPADSDDLRVLLVACASADVPVTVLGGGANSLVADDGVEGVVVRLPAAPAEEALDESGGSFVLSAGAPITKVPQLMKAHGLVGAEFLAGIPGTLGGATAMNAGTKNGELVQVVEAVELASASGVRWIPRDELTWRYRRCELPVGSVVTRLRLRLRRVDEAGLQASRAAMEADLGYRKRTQPLQLPNSGSVFTNPPGDHAGRLIEACGLKGRRQGGAQISELHANWIVNLGGARSSDVRFLIEAAKAEVAARFGVELTPEVKLLGRWGV